MKIFIAFICLFFSVSLFAQYSPQEIKKYKISKIIKHSANTDSSEKQTQEKRYDRNGNDTATYLDDQLYTSSKYEYNLKDQPTKRITYEHEGSERETAVYDYKPDGSCVISNTDKEFGMTDYTYYDKKGRLIKTKPGGDGVLTDIQYTYNNQGQCIKEVSLGEYKWTTTNTYDSRGLLIKSVTSNSEDGIETKSYSSYEYEFLK